MLTVTCSVCPLMTLSHLLRQRLMVKEKELSGEGTFFAPALGPSHHVPAHPQPARVRHH